ncbi:SIS domain-containing protein [bacterium M00.F.Ca.ET.228.01.1.1]|uniref:SIS domain-containing protein n=1 Tax=Paraburkholderia phenoliruptrix TaxID=252970 RepID=UPI00109308DC|nr:SIS domain-containing protein [Paraburkholderia phenoliruptrix]TGP42153.1 SIS domain-containing protein [bacterium M00.F.Ca.ET.228.01.1.1]TGR99584.1 SIS domain-containing protein [bacterium M00.F.Ca.ET.191.01.1.1]TGU03951.1 SIS domain-containing protein [bacterium M00.F.Ca.ET.155.01.1.1]MBW0448289.1 SIS domain-containing protein [Paraburkholderia phenoliruptrix]MBW9099500.1 SIS domain-containing protein [Paraburkholderia phenoliruptrix]
MTTSFDQETFAQSLTGATDEIARAAAFGRDIATRIDRVIFVACGAPNRIMLGLQYWIEHYSRTLEVRRFFPAEFMAQDTPRLDERTLVILASKSGTTQETVAAAEFLRNKPCITVGVTQTDDLPLASAVQHAFLMGRTDEAYFGTFIILQALIGGILAAREEWPLQDKLLASLAQLPKALAAAAAQNETRGAIEAGTLKDDRVLYHLASGPVFTTAYVFGVCILMESQWMHSIPLEAAEFFHGPFEVVDHQTPMILLLGEDPSRPLMERVVRFCERHAKRFVVYDSRSFDMPGIDPEIRPIVAPYILSMAIERISAQLAELNEQPLTTRRYMWKTEY